MAKKIMAYLIVAVIVFVLGTTVSPLFSQDSAKDDATSKQLEEIMKKLDEIAKAQTEILDLNKRILVKVK
jgi:flagellar basal body-associated protein FliL